MVRPHYAQSLRALNWPNAYAIVIPKLMETAILLYELRQIKPLEEFLSSIPEEEKKSLMVIALGADIEFALEKRNIPFQSGRDLRKAAHFECLTHAERIGREILDDPTFSFFSYRNVSLTQVNMPVLQDYLMYLFYFIDVLTTFAETYPYVKKILLFSFTYIPLETDGIMAPLEANAAIDAARMAGKKYGLTVVIPSFETQSSRRRMRAGIALFYLKRTFFGWGFSVLNVMVTIAIRRKKICILASDYWRNISPFIQELPEGELILLDRGESRRTGLGAIWKNRMRFIHIENFISGAERRMARAQANSFREQWEQIRDKNSMFQNAVFRGHSLTPVLAVAVRQILVRGGERAVNLINGSYTLCERMRPDIVLVRASYSTQIHFPILCYVARALGIPSLEVQHGLLYLGMRSARQRSVVEYVATYGPLTSAEFKRLGYTDETLFNIGSPRFDVYRAMRERKVSVGTAAKPFTVACIVPAILPQSWSDSYEVIDYLSGVARAAARIQNVRVILKVRPDPDNGEFYRSIVAQTFASVPHKIAQYEPLVEVYAESDAIIGIYSTTVLEALISGRPVIYNGTLEFHNALGTEFEEYATAGALIMAHTEQELADSLESLARDSQLRRSFVERADVFMKQNYSFDGKASRKLADVIRTLTLKKTETSSSKIVL